MNKIVYYIGGKRFEEEVKGQLRFRLTIGYELYDEDDKVIVDSTCPFWADDSWYVQQEAKAKLQEIQKDNPSQQPAASKTETAKT